MRMLLPVLLLGLCLCAPLCAQDADTDGDGVPDAIEKQLATDPNFAEQLTLVATDKTKAEGDSCGKDNYTPGLDVVAVSVGNVAGNRYLWRVDFADACACDKGGLIIYLYGDDNKATGRSDMGCEYMLVYGQGSAGLRAFAADGKETPEPLRAVMLGKSLYLCADVNIQQQEGKAVGAFQVLTETRDPYKGMDSIGLTKFAVAGDSPRAKIIGPQDLTASRNMQVTWGFRLLESLKQDPKTTVLHPWEGTLSGYELNIQTEYVNRHVMCVGRTPNGEDLGLENTRIERDERGYIKVNHQQQTAEPHIYAVGDIAGGILLAHKAAKEARIAVEVIAGEHSTTEDIVLPAVVFTDPEVAWAGLTEAEARERNLDVEVVKFPWVASGRALSFDRTDGLTKILVDRESERILGVGICGHGAGELISEGVFAIEMGATAKDLAECIHPHPTLSETLMECAEMFYDTATHTLPRHKKRDAAPTQPS